MERAKLRRAAELRPTDTGAAPRPEEERAPSAEAVQQLAALGVPLLAAPELLGWLGEGGEGSAREAVLQALKEAGAVKARHSLASPVP